jgi:hypothetical protein
MQAEIDDAVSQDCPQCGEMAIQAIEQPFIPDVRACWLLFHFTYCHVLSFLVTHCHFVVSSQDQLASYVESWSMGRDQDEKLEFGMSADERMRRDLEEQDADAGRADGSDLDDLDDFDPLAGLGF